MTGARREIPLVTQGISGEIFPTVSDGSAGCAGEPWEAETFGIDRLSLSFPVASFDPFSFTSESVARHSDGGATVARRYAKTYTLTEDYKGVAVMVGVSETSRGWTGKVECNPSRFFDPAGCSLVGPHAFLRFVPHALSLMVAAHGIEPLRPYPEWRVKRLDLARDFRGVSQPGVLIDALRPLKRKYARKVDVFYDPHQGGAQTLSVGTNARMVRLYDQHAAYADKGAPAGSLRWEAQLRGDFLKATGVEQVGDLSVPVLGYLATGSWEWSKCGTTVSHARSVARQVDGLVQSGDLSPAKAQRLLGQMVAEATGMTWASDRKTVAEYGVWKERLGCTPATDLLQALFNGEARVEARLDWQTGHEVLTEEDRAAEAA